MRARVGADSGCPGHRAVVEVRLSEAHGQRWGGRTDGGMVWRGVRLGETHLHYVAVGYMPGWSTGQGWHPEDADL